MRQCVRVESDDNAIPSTRRPFINTWVDVTLARGLLRCGKEWLGRAKLFERLEELATNEPQLEFSEATVVSRLDQLAHSGLIEVVRQSDGHDVAGRRLSSSGRETLLQLLREAEERHRATQ
jgi:hypothetical protein